MNVFVILLMIVSLASGAEDAAEALLREVKLRKEALRVFREQVTLGNQCEPRNFDCFAEKLSPLVKGHPEDLTAARSILEPFYLRSLKEGFPPCSVTCQNDLLAKYIDIFLQYLALYKNEQKKNYAILYPGVRDTKIRTLMELTAFHQIRKHAVHLRQKVAELNYDRLSDKSLWPKDLFLKSIERHEQGVAFSDSILCRLNKGDPIYDELASPKGKKKADLEFQERLKEFDEFGRKSCADSTPLSYRGVDAYTRKYYTEKTEAALGKISCKLADFACVRSGLRKLDILYTSDVKLVGDFLTAFFARSKPPTCDEGCEASQLIQSLQTWITYLSRYDRSKLASAMDPARYPEAPYLLISEDVTLYEILRDQFTPLIEKFGKIDPRSVKDEGMRSEMRSLGKDLSDFASGKMLRESVICKMESWTASNDKYLSPYAEKEQNKKFEEAFLEFKSNVCK